MQSDILIIRMKKIHLLFLFFLSVPFFLIAQNTVDKDNQNSFINELPEGMKELIGWRSVLDI